jgi:hypothetical protein
VVDTGGGSTLRVLARCRSASGIHRDGRRGTRHRDRRDRAIPPRGIRVPPRSRRSLAGVVATPERRARTADRHWPSACAAGILGGWISVLDAAAQSTRAQAPCTLRPLRANSAPIASRDTPKAGCRYRNHVHESIVGCFAGPAGCTRATTTAARHNCRSVLAARGESTGCTIRPRSRSSRTAAVPPQHERRRVSTVSGPRRLRARQSPTMSFGGNDGERRPAGTARRTTG